MTVRKTTVVSALETLKRAAFATDLTTLKATLVNAPNASKKTVAANPPNMSKKTVAANPQNTSKKTVAVNATNTSKKTVPVTVLGTMRINDPVGVMTITILGEMASTIDLNTPKETTFEKDLVISSRDASEIILDALMEDATARVALMGDALKKNAPEKGLITLRKNAPRRIDSETVLDATVKDDLKNASMRIDSATALDATVREDLKKDASAVVQNISRRKASEKDLVVLRRTDLRKVASEVVLDALAKDALERIALRRVTSTIVQNTSKRIALRRTASDIVLAILRGDSKRAALRRATFTIVQNASVATDLKKIASGLVIARSTTVQNTLEEGENSVEKMKSSLRVENSSRSAHSDTTIGQSASRKVRSSLGDVPTTIAIDPSSTKIEDTLKIGSSLKSGHTIIGLNSSRRNVSSLRNALTVTDPSSSRRIGSTMVDDRSEMIAITSMRAHSTTIPVADMAGLIPVGARKGDSSRDRREADVAVDPRTLSKTSAQIAAVDPDSMSKTSVQIVAVDPGPMSKTSAQIAAMDIPAVDAAGKIGSMAFTNPPHFPPTNWTSVMHSTSQVPLVKTAERIPRTPTRTVITQTIFPFILL